jgi:hypothetical protein
LQWQSPACAPDSSSSVFTATIHRLR